MTRFGLLCLVLFGALGVGIGQQVHSLIQRREITNAANVAIFSVRFISGTYDTAKPTPAERVTLEHGFLAASDGGAAVGAQAILNGQVVFSTDNRDLGRTLPTSADYRQALQGPWPITASAPSGWSWKSPRAPS